jgi:hypothetical protein
MKLRPPSIVALLRNATMLYYPIVTRQGADVKLPRKPHTCNNIYVCGVGGGIWLDDIITEDSLTYFSGSLEITYVGIFRITPVTEVN